MLEKKREVIPDLRTNLKEASDRFEEATKAREQRKKVDVLKQELAWAHVGSKQRVRLLFFSFFICLYEHWVNDDVGI
jgi:hypothetical protein